MLILLSLSLMKCHKLLSTSSLHLHPLTICHPLNILGQWSVSTLGLTGPRLSQERWVVPGQPPVLHLTSGLSYTLMLPLGIVCMTQRLLKTICSLILLYLLSFHRGFATLSSDEELANLVFLKPGLWFLQQQRGHYPLQYWELFLEKNTYYMHTVCLAVG